MNKNLPKSTDIEKYVEKLVLNFIKENHLDLELVNVEFIKEGPNWYLRIYIDKQNGITIDDCEFVSRSIETNLDNIDLIKQAYILEVSSPGLDRVLKKESDFIKYSGEIVDIKLYKAFNGLKEFQGELKYNEKNIITIITENNEELNFNIKDIAKIKLAIIF